MAIDTAPTGSGTRSAHPLDALDPAEIQAAGNVLRADSRVPDTALFAYFGLDEPSKDAVAGFTAGDPVDLVDNGGRPIARGLVNYDATELPGLLGRSTPELAAELGPGYEREVVHRDDLVLL